MRNKKLDLSALDKAYLSIDFRKKDIFLDKKGNDITEGILSYEEGERIIEDALNQQLP